MQDSTSTITHSPRLFAGQTSPDTLGVTQPANSLPLRLTILGARTKTSEPHPSHGAWWELVEEGGDGHAAAAADLQEREEAGVALAALHRGDVVEVHARKLRELLLREAALLAQAAHR